MNPERAASHSAHTHVETKHRSVVSIPHVPDRVASDTFNLLTALILRFSPSKIVISTSNLFVIQFLLDKEPPPNASMGRWSHLDPDYERLPEGISRVGYDADTESYTFQDRSGSYWESRPGRRYGPLRRVHTSPSVQTVAVGDAPHTARVDKILKDARECDVEEGVEDEESELYQGAEAGSKDQDPERCCEKHTPTWHKKHIRNVTGSFSRLSGYFRGTQIERRNTHGLRRETFPVARRNTSMAAHSQVLGRAVTFDEILARRADMDYCTHCGKIKGR